MTAYRYIIFTRVSSDPQADPQHVSFDVQLSESRKAVKQLEQALRASFHEVGEPIRLTQSTDIPGHNPLDVLRDASPEGYGRLYDLLREKRIDFVIAYHSSRLFGRTDVLPRQLQHLFELARAQYYFVLQPRHLVPPSQLGRRGRNDLASYLVDAIDARRNVEEIDLLQDRWRTGMTGHVAAGRWRFAHTPWWAERPVIGVDELGNKLYGPMRLIPERAEHLRACARYYLEGNNFREVSRWSAEVLGGKWSESKSNGSVYRWLTNPAAAGVMIFPQRGHILTTDFEGEVRKKRQLLVSSTRGIDLALAFLDGNDIRTPDEKAAGVIVAAGQWEAPFSTPEELDLWRAVHVERMRRSNDPSGMAMARANIHVLSGLLYCIHCGERLVISAARPAADGGRLFYYECSSNLYASQLRNPRPCPKNFASERKLERRVVEYLQAVLDDPALLVAQLESVHGLDETAHQLAVAEQAQRDAGAALGRLDSAWLAGIYGDDLERYRALRDEAYGRVQQAELRVARLREQASRQRSSDDTLKLIEDVTRHAKDWSRENRGVFKVRLGQLLERIEVDNNIIKRVVWRTF